jgi:ubiquinone/menaquinone biosynthesis C-methylase UbiE
METARYIPWAKFWEERGRSYPEDNPIAIDGWDYGVSLMGLEQAEWLREQVTRELDLGPQSKFLEVGCGAGMFLAPISELVIRAVGCDLSENMVKRAQQINNELMIQVTEACYLPYVSNEFDAILVYSVFHYFPSNDYANRTLRELLRVCRKNGRIWIGDIPDKSKQQQALLHREQLMKQSQPKWRWPNIGPLEHRFYDPKFFIEFCKRAGCKCQFVQQTVEGYVQGNYRYNAFIEKR